MSAASLQQRYQQALTLLRAMQQNPDGPADALLVNLRHLQPLLADAADAIDAATPTLDATLKPWETEINKQLRLLETDAVFLQAARQPTTIRQRCQQVQTRVGLLLNYCEAASALCAASDEVG